MSANQPSVHQLYQRLETVGKGAYGSVHKGRHIPTGNIVALKIINLDTADDDVEDIQREVALLSQLRDAPNVTKYYGCYMDGPRVWIVMEFAQGGSVLSLMKASPDGCIEERFISVIIREVLVGLSYLHKTPVIHRDMKAANVLVTSACKVMICDFGVSALLATTSSKRNTLTGTPYWMAPEVVQSVPAYDTKADIWSLGIMIYEMFKGTPPHAHLDKFQVMDIIPRIKPPKFAENEGSKDMRDFMALCLKESPSERLPAEELLKTRWIKSSGKNVVLKELISRLERTAPRASLMEPLDWENESTRYSAAMEDRDWEFDTLHAKSPSTLSPSYQDDDDTGYQSSQLTVRAQASGTLPSSLRMLFGDEGTGGQEAVRFPHNPTKLGRDSPYLSPSSLTMVDSQQALETLNVMNDDDLTTISPNHRQGRRLRPQPLSSNSEQQGSPPLDSVSPSTTPALVVGDGNGIPADEVQTKMEDSAYLPSGIVPLSTSPPPMDPSERHPSRPDDADIAPPPTFQFPPLRVHRPSQLSVTHADRNQGLKLRSADSNSNHQSTLSLDEPSSSSPSAISTLLPISRSRSATTPPPTSAIEPDFTARKPQHIPYTSKKANDSSQTLHYNLGTPGLKDVLKIPSLSSEHRIGMADLLPPSPSVVTVPRYFGSGKGNLSSSNRKREDLSPFEGDDGRPNHKPSAKPPGSVSNGQHEVFPLQPLDYSALITNDNHSKQLEQTISALTHWLATVEAGLNLMLDNAIEEEQEGSSSGSVEGHGVYLDNSTEM